MASRKPEACVDTEGHLRSVGGLRHRCPSPYMGDVEAVNALVDRTVGQFGRLDIVVNNAANALTLPFGQLTIDAWDKSLGTNLRGPVFQVERALPYLETSARRRDPERDLGWCVPLLALHHDVRRGQGSSCR